MTYKLLCFDMDGVIFKDINFWMELHKAFGTLEQGKVLTKKYLHSDYDRLVQEVVATLWKGKDAKEYYDLVQTLEYLPGVQETFAHIHAKDYITAIISASSIDVARRVQKDHGVDYLFANELLIKNGLVSGEFLWPIGAGKEKKATIVQDLCTRLSINPAEVIYVGDSDTDVQACILAGLSIAFNSQSALLKQVATYVVDSNNLADIIKYIP